METKTEIADIKETKTKVAEKPSDIGNLDASSFRPAVSKKRDLDPSSQTAGPKMRRWHWTIFVFISVLLGFLVFYTILHMIGTTTSMARRLHAPSPVETVPVRRQTLDEVIGGSGAIEQAETVNLITQLTAQVLEVPVKIGDVVKKGRFACSLGRPAHQGDGRSEPRIRGGRSDQDPERNSAGRSVTPRCRTRVWATRRDWRSMRWPWPTQR